MYRVVTSSLKEALNSEPISWRCIPNSVFHLSCVSLASNRCVPCHQATTRPSDCQTVPSYYILTAPGLSSTIGAYDIFVIYPCSLHAPANLSTLCAAFTELPVLLSNRSTLLSSEFRFSFSASRSQFLFLCSLTPVLSPLVLLWPQPTLFLLFA